MLTPKSRQLFSCDPNIVYIDHGGYGVTPKEVQVFRAEMQEKLEAAPTPFFDIECRAEWMATKAMVAHRFSARAEDIALIDNVTDGINAILRSLTLQPDDEILITSMTYGAIALGRQAYHARETGAHVVEAHIPFSYPQPCAMSSVDRNGSVAAYKTGDPRPYYVNDSFGSADCRDEYSDLP